MHKLERHNPITYAEQGVELNPFEKNQTNSKGLFEEGTRDLESIGGALIYSTH